MKVYIAGPMRGIAYYNFPMFDKAAEALRQLGHEPISPADIDREHGLTDDKLPTTAETATTFNGTNLRETVKRDVEALSNCEGICLLPNWHKSLGAKAEYSIAMWLDLEVLLFDGKLIKTP